MQEKRTPVFQSEDGSWGHITQTVNPLICTIEYKCHSGFPSKEEAEESYRKSQDAYSNQIQQLKKSRKIPFTFSEYLDYWFREVYSSYSTSKSTLFKYRWVLYQIILPQLQNDVLLDCVSEEFLNKLLDSCQGYCQNGGYYAYKLLNIILWSAYQNNYIPEKEFPKLKHYPDPQHKSVFKKASRQFPGELAKLKESNPCPFTFTEYLKYWFEQIYIPESTSGSTKVKYHWIIYHIILPRVTADPLLPYVDTEYIENLIESCRNYCTSAESAVYKLLCRILYSAWSRGFLETYLVSEITEREEPKSDLRIYAREQLKVFLRTVYEDSYAHRLEF